ncbi:MAG TPA: hypothetical protein VD731_06485 [Nitrosopumilaceae archaeon]|nr:hypothetical protein [Nitrosopumilaceae archaeon]
MALVRRCNCDYDQCEIAQNIRNAHVGDECIHYFGQSHKLRSNLHAGFNSS